MSRRWMVALVLGMSGSLHAGGNVSPAEEGYRVLLEKGFLPADFDQEVWNDLPKSWEKAAREKFEKASAKDRRAMMFERYGFQDAPGMPERELPLQYTPNGKGGWVMNCFTCHGGKVNGVVIPGLPNSHIALQTLIDDVRWTKVRKGKALTHMDRGSLFVPLGTTRGTTNAINFGVALAVFRDHDLNLRNPSEVPAMLHHDVDAPPWWHVKRKTHLYAEGFAPKSHRSLMQFLLIPENGPQAFLDYEEDFKKIYAYVLSLEAPKYPFSIEQTLATKGEAIFAKNCAECHGTYGKHSEYPNVNVPIEDVGTDRVRYDALGPMAYDFYDKSWFDALSKDPVNKEPAGYVAPPLDGIWATAPYFHNGSVPTLWHLLNSSDRPVVWKRTEDGFDQKKVGLEVETMSSMPADVKNPAERRYYFDTTRKGKGAGGHTFPDKLTTDEKTALLEYLKTL